MFKKNKFIFILILLIGIITGSFISVLLSYVLPPGVVRDVFVTSINPSIGDFTLDVLAFKITFGLSITINLCSLIGLGIAAYIFRWY